MDLTLATDMLKNALFPKTHAWPKITITSSEDTYNEKRSSARVNYLTSTFCRATEPSKSSWFLSRTLEISDGGMRLLSNRMLEVNSKLEMHLKLPQAKRASKIKGRIVWITSKKIVGNDHFVEAGIQFEDQKDVSKRSKMFEFIAENLADCAAKKATEISARPVQSPAEIDAAFGLLYQEYIKRGYCPESPAAMHYNHFVFTRGSQTFIYKADHRVIGTVSLLLDSPCGLPMEGTFKKEIEAHRKRGTVLSEVGLLTVDGNLLGRKKFSMVNFRKYQVVFELFGAMLHHAVKVGATDLVIAVHPKHLALYEYLGFSAISGEKTYSDGKPALAMKMNVAFFMQRIRTSKMGDLYRAISAHQQRQVNNHQWTNDSAQTYLMAKKNLWSALSERSQTYLASLYPNLITAASLT